MTSIFDRSFLFAFLISIFIFIDLSAQDIRVEGTLICFEGGRDDVQRTAEYIIVMPMGRPDLATYCDQKGYYKMLIPYKTYVDLSFPVLFIGRSGVIATDKFHINPEDKFRKIVKKGMTFDQDCEQITNDMISAEAIMDSLKAPPYAAYAPLSIRIGASEVGFAGNLFSIMMLAIGFAAAPPPPDSTIVDTLDINDIYMSPKKIKDSVFLKRSYSEFSQNIGFNFTPFRNLNESIFWNSSALIAAPKNQVSLQLDDRRFLRLNNFITLNQNTVFGVGMYLFRDEEERTIFFESNRITEDFKNDELMIISSISKKIKENISTGISLKFLYQKVGMPSGIERTVKVTGSQFADTTYKIMLKNEITRNVDIDLSATVEPFPAIRFGVSLLNLLGTRFYEDNKRNQHLRSVGLGITYQRKRINIGYEAFLREKDRGILAFGINYVPINKVVLSFGLSSSNNKYAIGIKYRNLSYSYNHDHLRGEYHLFSSGFRY